MYMTFKSKQASPSAIAPRVFALVPIEKIWQENWSINTGKEAYSEHHCIHNPTTQLAQPTWEWADIINNRLIWVEKGCLLSVSIPDGDVALDLQNPNTIYAFKELAFEPREAPY